MIADRVNTCPGDCGQQQEEIELRGGQADLVALGRDRPAERVDLDAAQPRCEPARVFARRCAGDAGARHPADELREENGFVT